MAKKAYAIYQKPLNVFKNRMFNVLGFVRAKDRARKFTRLTIETVIFDRLDEIRDTFFVYFKDEIKEFVDKQIEENYLIEVTGHLLISSKSTEKQQIIVLEGRHILAFKNFVNVYEEPETKRVSPDKLSDSMDLAF